MRDILFALAVTVALGVTVSAGAEQATRKLAIWNNSDEPIVVFVETPSPETISRRRIEVPARTTVFNIPVPNVDGDQFAVALTAHATGAGLKVAEPATLVGFTKLFPTRSSPRINFETPVLRYEAYVPPKPYEGGYGGAAGVRSEEHRRLASLSSPVYVDDAQQLLRQAMQNPNRIDFGKIRNKAQGAL